MEPALTTQRNDTTGRILCQEFSSLQNVLPGMESAALRNTGAAERAATRMDLGQRLASSLLGCPVELRDQEDRWELVDRASGRPLVQLEDDLHVVGDGGEVGRRVAPERAGRYATLLLGAAQPGNHLVGILDGGEKGEFVGGSTAWKSSLRLDPNWAETLRRRSRRILRKELMAMLRALPANEKAKRRYPMSNGKLNPQRLTLKMLTLAPPHAPGSKTLDQLQVINRALGLMRKRDLWTDAIWGGSKGLEDKLTWQGAHVHAHCLLLSRWIDRRVWQRAFWECLNKAWMEAYGHGMELMPAGLPMLDVRMVRKKGTGGDDSVGLEDAIDECCKYVTKTSDLVEPDEEGRTVSGETLLELCDIDRWPRMFELLGACRTPPAPAGTLLDTSCISDAGGVLKLVEDYWTQARERDEPSLSESLILNVASRAGVVDEPEWRSKAERGEFLAKHREKPPSWRDLMGELPMHEWIHLMMGRARAGFAYRLGWLKEHNPTLMLVDMTGKLVAKQAREWEGPDLAPCE